jgi:hypothetical protein
MTVLPNAPIDSTTGLPIPTIAVGTAGVTSVITDKGDVWDITGFGPTTNVAFSGDTLTIFSDQAIGYSSSGTAILTADIAVTTWDYKAYRSNTIPALLDSVSKVGVRHGSELVTAGNNGLVTISENLTTPANGSVAYLTSTYNSGYMTGDIKGAWLSDTDTTNVVGTELVTNGTFDTDISGWTAGSGATIVWDAGTIKVSHTTAAYSQARQSFTTVVGKKYTVQATSSNHTGSGTRRIYVGNIAGSQATLRVEASTEGVKVGTFTATAATTYVSLANEDYSNVSTNWDNVSIRLAEADRSVNNNGLQVNGTITKTAVATGADLVAYSGFSSANYLEQPYNADLDFGTGDFSISCWFNTPNVGGGQKLFQKGDNVNGINMWMAADLKYMTIYILGSPFTTPQGAYGNNVWNHVVAKRASGVVNVWINGVLLKTGSSTGNASYTTTAKIGVNCNSNTKLALVRVSATAPTAAQIKEIYEAEKPLFQENAKCTLNGTSDAVQCLAYDDSTELLHVGTSGGRSTFQGLRRVDETATNTTEISAQGGMIIEETA